MMKTFSPIEALEPRIAPAVLNPAGTVLTYTDLDGDLVKVTFTKAVMTSGNFIFSTGGVDGNPTTPQALTVVDLFSNPGASFTLTATPQKTAGIVKGDSHANIGIIDAPGTDLGAIKVDGDVLTINAGSGDPGTVGLKSFTALSLGQASTSVATSTLYNVGAFNVKTNVSNAELKFTGGVKSVSVGGNLQELNGVARLVITGDVGSLKIGGSVIGRNGTKSNISVSGTTGTLSIGGSVSGGDVGYESLGGSAQVEAGAVKTFSIGGDLRGGRGTTGGVVTIGSVGTARIGGSLLAQDDISGSGIFRVHGNARSVTIGGSIFGGDAVMGVGYNGLVDIQGNVGTFTLGHDLVGGSASSSNVSSFYCSVINVAGTVGTMTIGGSVIGDSTHAATIAVGGGGVNAVIDAIKTLNIKGSVLNSSILAGYSIGVDLDVSASNTNSGFGSVSIGGDLVASYISAGGRYSTFANSVATIGSVKIGGVIRGVAGDNTTVFSIVAPILNKLTVGKASYSRVQLVDGVAFYSVGKAAAFSRF